MLSVNELKSAAEQKSDNAEVHNNLGLSYFEMKNYEESKNNFSKAISLINQDKLEKDLTTKKHASSYLSNMAQA